MKFFKIAPLVRLPIGKSQSFTYFSYDELEIGDLVEIWLGRKKSKGIVLNECAKPNFQTKNAIILEKKVLTLEQISVARKISMQYFTSLGICLKLFLPHKTKKELPPKFNFKNRESKINYKLTEKQKEAIDKISKSEKRQFLLFGPASSGKTDVLFELVKKTIKEKRQFLLLIPEIFLGFHEIERYYQKLVQDEKLLTEEEIAFYHSDLKKSESTFIQSKVKSGKIKLVIATRNGLFLPFKNLDFIAIDEEQSETFKQWDKSPFFQAKNVAKILTNEFDARLILSSATPSTETFLEKNQEKITLPRLKTDKIKAKEPEIKVKNLYDEKYIENFQFKLSKELKEKIELTKEKKEMTFFLLPKKGKSQRVFCQDCKKPLLCKNCNSPLNHIGDNYKCLKCSFKQSALLGKCPNCGSFRLVNFGFGIESIADEIKTALPKLKVATADKDTFSKKRSRESLFKKIKAGKVDVLVGTYAIAKGFDLPNLSLVVVPNADGFAGKNTYLFDQHFLSNLFQLAGRINRPNSKQDGQCLIYTKKPDNPLFEYLKKYDWQEFLSDEQENRNALKLPPFGKILKLTNKNLSREKVEKETKKVYYKLTDEIEKNSIKAKISKEKIKKKGRFFNQSIFIKLSTAEIPKWLKFEILSLKQDWRIDPETIDF